MEQQEKLVKSLIQIVNIMYLLEGEHQEEVNQLAEIGNSLIEKLNDTNKIKFQIWLKHKMEEHDSE